MKTRNVYIVTCRGELNEEIVSKVLAVSISDAISKVVLDYPKLVIEKVEYDGIVFE